MSRALPIFILVFLMLVCGCTGYRAASYTSGSPAIKGSGVSQSESRSVESFDRIKMDSVVDVTVTFGDTPAISVTTDQNLLPLVRTVVVNRQLVIDCTGSLTTNIGIQVAVTMHPESLVSCKVDGTGDLNIKGYSGASLELNSEGPGDIQVSGTVDSVGVTTESTGDVDLTLLESRRANVECNSTGDVTVNASEFVKAETNSVGDITILGSAKEVQAFENSVGDIIRK